MTAHWMRSVEPLVYQRWARIHSALTRQMARLWGPVPTESEHRQSGLRSFESEAEEVMSLRKLQRARLIIQSSFVILVLSLIWAGVAEIDEVARGDGRVIPSRQLQVIQSLDGGVVTDILVREGELVAEGQLLLRIDETRASSGVRESAAQVFALTAREARLRALAEGTPFKPPHARTDSPEELGIVHEEQRLYKNKLEQIKALISISHQQLAQRQEELTEVKSKRSASERALTLLQEELNKTRPLLSSGAVSEVDVLRLERDVNRARGDTEQATAMQSKVMAAITEAQRKIEETELALRNEARRELSEVLGKLNALGEGAIALVDRVEKAQVKSPVRGRIQRLMANTVGGVVQAGKDIVEIVPLDDTLVLEARVSPRDIAFIHPDQKATVKLTAYDFSIYGGLDARVLNISPDTVIDEKGNAYYVVRVRTERPAFNEKAPIIPGMMAEVDILTGQKSILSYLLKPILRAKAYAFRER